MPINRSPRAGLVTLLIAGGSWMGSASAATLQVCASCSHTTIQSAVNDAADNDVINIAAGRYAENITIIGKTLTLLGTGGLPNGQTLVTAAGRGPVFTLGSGVTGDVNHLIVISGITVSGGNHSGGTGVGGGIQVRAGSYLHLLNSIVTGNYATFGGGVGINSPGAPATSIISSLISDNISPGTPRGVGLGGGVYARQGSTVAIDHALIARNQSRGGGGIYTEAQTTLTLTNSTVTGNTTEPFFNPVGANDGDGGGLESHGDFSISESMFVHNTVFGTNGGGGIAIGIQDAGPHTIRRTTLSHNMVSVADGSPRGGGLLAYGGSGSYTLDHSFVEQNLAGGGVWSDPGVALVLVSSVVSDNAGGNICSQPGCQ